MVLLLPSLAGLENLESASAKVKLLLTGPTPSYLRYSHVYP